MPPKEEFIALMNALAGYKIRFKEIHWLNTSKTIHEITDNIGWNIERFLDTFTEEFLSIYERSALQPDDYNATIMLSDTFENLLSGMVNDIQEFRSKLTQPVFNGMLSVIDSFLSDLNIENYRKSLS